jgi:hypothetical protein
MLPDFLKGNHFAISPATVHLLWGTRESLVCHNQQVTPVKGDSQGIFVRNAQVRGFPDRWGPARLSQVLERYRGRGPRSADSGSPIPEAYPGLPGPEMPLHSCSRKAHRFISVASPGKGRLRVFQVVTAPVQVAQGQNNCWMGQRQWRQRRRHQRRSHQVQRGMAEHWLGNSPRLYFF